MEGGLLSLKWNNHRSSFIHMLSTLRRKEMYADVTIACDGKFFPTHKLVLSNCSEYFQEMFQQTQCKHPVVVLKDIHCEEFEALLNYMYIGEVNVVQEKLSSLIKTAECLKIKGLAVPDDPPTKVIMEKRTLNHGYSSEKKRKRKETNCSSKEYSGYSSSNRTCSPVTNLMSLQTDANVNLRECEENLEKSNMEMCSPNKIKEEPDDVIEVVDSKEGILPNYHPLLSKSSENISESQDSWKPENCNTDDFSITDECEASNAETSSLNDEVWSRANFGSNQWMKNEIAYDSSMSVPSASPDTTPGLWPLSEDPSEMKNQFYVSSGSPSTNVQSSQCSQQSPYNLASNLRSIKSVTVIYPCKICHKVFDHKGNYKKHIMTHTGERPFKCDFCEYSSSQKGNLFTHLRKLHPNVRTYSPKHEGRYC